MWSLCSVSPHYKTTLGCSLCAPEPKKDKIIRVNKIFCAAAAGAAAVGKKKRQMSRLIKPKLRCVADSQGRCSHQRIKRCFNLRPLLESTTMPSYVLCGVSNFSTTSPAHLPHHPPPHSLKRRENECHGDHGGGK